MIILNAYDDVQEFPIIPTKRVGGEIYIEFTNETTKDVFSFKAVINYEDLDLLYVGTDGLLGTLKENTFYNVKVYFIQTLETIYLDRAFCTNQPKETFSINDGEYNFPNIDNNNYITI